MGITWNWAGLADRAEGLLVAKGLCEWSLTVAKAGRGSREGPLLAKTGRGLAVAKADGGSSEGLPVAKVGRGLHEGPLLAKTGRG